MTASYLQATPDSTGKKVRNESTELGQPDGTVATVHQQVVSLKEEDRQLLTALLWNSKRLLAVAILVSGQSIEDVDQLAAEL